MDSPGGESPMRKEAEEGALLARMDPTGGESPVRMKANKFSGMLAELWEKQQVEVRRAAGMKALATSQAMRKNRSEKMERWKPCTTKSEGGLTLAKKKNKEVLKDMPNKFVMLDPDGDDEKDEMTDRGKSAIEEEHMPGDWKNPSDRGEESVTVGSGKSGMDQAVISPEMEESLTEAVKQAQEVALLLGLDSTAGGSPIQKQAEEGDLLVGMHSMAGKPSIWDQAILEFPGVDFSWMTPAFRKDWIKKFMKMMHRMPDSLDIRKALADSQAKCSGSTRTWRMEMMRRAWANPSDTGEVSVTVGSGKSAMGQAVISPETEESLTEAEEEAEEGPLLAGMDSTGGEPSMRKDESGKRSEMVGMESEMPRVVEGSMGTLLFMREHYGQMEAKEKEAKKKQEEEREMRKRSEKQHADHSQLHAEERQQMQRQRELLDLNKNFLNSVAEAKARDEEAGKAQVYVAEAGRPEESVTEAVKEAEEGALLVGMDSTGGEPLMRTEESGKRSEMSQRTVFDVMIGGTIYSDMPFEMAVRLSEDPENKKAATQRALLAGNSKLAKKQNSGAKAEANAREEAGNAEVSVTEPERPEESVTVASGKSAIDEEVIGQVTESVKMEAVTVGSSKSADEVMGKETLQELLKGMPNKFAILDPDGDDEKDEIDRGKSDVEDEHMPSNGKNPSDRGEESVTVGSGKSAMGQAVISPKTSVTEAEVAVKEAEEVPPLVGLNSKGGESSMRKEAEEKSVKGSDMEQHVEEPTAPVPDYFSTMTAKYQEKLMKLNKARAVEREALLARFEKLTQSKRSANSAGGDSCILKNKPAVPSATRSTGQYSVQDDLDHDRGKSTTALAKKTAAEEMAEEADKFARYQTLWESKWRKTCGLFSHTTVLSSMQFTHYTPGRTPHSSSCFTPETLQIFSIKLTGLDGGLEFPLSVYGVVAIRDIVDRNRNILFSRDISDRQKLTEIDPFLHLIGPSRAIVFTDKVCIEIQLRVVAGSQDKALISCARRYAGGNGPGVSTICFKNVFCTLELSLEPVKQTVQATILGVQVLDYNGSWPFEYGGLVACSPLSGEVVITDGRFSRNIDPVSSPIVLIDSKHEAVPKGNGGFVHLWRQVVSVQLQGGLDVVIKGYSKSGAVAAEASARFLPKACNISHKRCLLGDAEVTITVAWSRVATSKIGVALENCARRCF